MQEPWTSRTFKFDFPVARIAVLLSRLRGTAVRMRSAVPDQEPATLAARNGKHWSMQEHVGHLWELDGLHLRRLAELARDEEHLSAADMSNQATWQANFNERAFLDVMQDFESRRSELLAHLISLDAEALSRVALHPRLKTPMRAVDVAFFAAEHDDQHVAAFEAIAANC